MKHFNKFLILLAFLGLSISATLAQSTYIITGNGGTFTATKNGTAVATNTLLQLVIDAVKTNANGADCTIQFENGSNTLNTGDNNITFDGGANGTAWGLITLTGKITSTSVMWSGGTICLKNGVSVNSKADITNPGGGDALAIYHQSTGTLTISEGTVKNTGTTTITIFAVGPLNITGGRVEANGVNANAIVVGAEGKVTISGDAVVTSKNTNAYTPGTIFVGDNADGDCLEINGGTVENTADLGGAIANFSATGTVNISGGTVSATTGVAIWNDDTGKITISETAKVTSKNLPGSSNLTGTIVLKDAGTATDCRLEITGGTVENTVELDFYNDIYGIAICNLSTGAVNISDGDISASIAVYNYSPGAVNISGGEISGDYLAVYGGVGMVNISGGKISASPTDGYMKIAIMIGNGTVNISGGEISANVNTVGDAVYAVANMDGTVNISGGEISASATNAGSIWAVVNGKITTISGGNISTSSTDGYAVINIGTLTISGGTIENTSGYGNTIFNRDATSVIEVSGGTVRSSGGDAIVNNGGKLTIKERGMVIALEGYAVDNSSGTLTISHNSIIFACGKNASEVINGAYTQQNNAVVAAWDNKTNITTYTANTTDDLFTDPAAASALWTKQDGNSGIAVKYGATDGFIPIAGVTVTGAPEIISLTISPKTANLQAGASQQFTATVITEGGADETVTWSITGNHSTLTTISATGLLTLGANETAETITVRATSAFDPTFHDDAIVTTGNVGIAPPSSPEEGDVRVYPNPTNGELRIESGELRMENVEIFDIYGRNVGSKFPSKNLEGCQPKADGVVFDISHLHAGIYFLKIHTENGIVTRKVVKE